MVEELVAILKVLYKKKRQIKDDSSEDMKTLRVLFHRQVSKIYIKKRGLDKLCHEWNMMEQK